MSIEYKEGFEDSYFESILDLYTELGWTNYTSEPHDLKKALENSTYIVLAFSSDKLVGLARSISDEISIHYLQDILVSPKFQKKGIGRGLMDLVLARFSNVRTHMILTDNELRQRKFYESLGYKNLSDLKKIPLNSYVKMNGVELS
ncbi:MAG: GNAT family N-acetyltransferase [Bacteriovoracaceae bacterium]|jgi:GNAT superfamily N-acetyltransferase|nr:GNAT family N-acetyltransferase [Bacteriovoracaceae bacterium]